MWKANYGGDMEQAVVYVELIGSHPAVPRCYDYQPL
jgi:hypothetical protein